MMVLMAILVTTGCSILISTPPVARIQIYGTDNKVSEYVVVLEHKPSQSTIDIPITDRYAINLDFQWLMGSDYAYQNNQTDVDIDLNEKYQERSVTPWMMCTYRF